MRPSVPTAGSPPMQLGAMERARRKRASHPRDSAPGNGRRKPAAGSTLVFADNESATVRRRAVGRGSRCAWRNRLPTHRGGTRRGLDGDVSPAGSRTRVLPESRGARGEPRRACPGGENPAVAELVPGQAVWICLSTSGPLRASRSFPRLKARGALAEARAGACPSHGRRRCEPAGFRGPAPARTRADTVVLASG